jgi:RNA polymerase sigma-70 factor (ECF subfamily)
MSDDITRSLDLVLKAQDGDQAALNRLIERYYERVRRVVRVRLGPRLRESLDSGDILQETFLAAVRSFQNFEMRDEASLIHWLARLAERQIIAAADYHGAKKRDAARNISMTSSRGSGSITIAFPDDSTAPLEKIAAREESAKVERCLDELPDEYRELIVLRNYAGASWEVVAEETDRPSAAAARMMYSRAMLELGKLLREKGLR